MLREVGNRDLQVEEDFLVTRYKHMPRIMLRYTTRHYGKLRPIIDLVNQA